MSVNEPPKLNGVPSMERCSAAGSTELHQKAFLRPWIVPRRSHLRGSPAGRPSPWLRLPAISTRGYDRRTRRGQVGHEAVYARTRFGSIKGKYLKKEIPCSRGFDGADKVLGFCETRLGRVRGKITSRISGTYTSGTATADSTYSTAELYTCRSELSLSSDIRRISGLCSSKI